MWIASTTTRKCAAVKRRSACSDWTQCDGIHLQGKTQKEADPEYTHSRHLRHQIHEGYNIAHTDKMGQSSEHVRDNPEHGLAVRLFRESRVEETLGRPAQGNPSQEQQPLRSNYEATRSTSTSIRIFVLGLKFAPLRGALL